MIAFGARLFLCLPSAVAFHTLLTDTRLSTALHASTPPPTTPTPLVLPAPTSASPLPSSPNVNTGVIFQYSPSSLTHLESIELPNEPTTTISTEKLTAMAAATIGAILVGGLGELWFENAFFCTATWGGALGYWAAGGTTTIRTDELPKNGGREAKLVMDRPARLQRIIHDLEEGGDCVVRESDGLRDKGEVLEWVTRVHGEGYLKELREAVEEADETDRPRRLNPTQSRTLVDRHSYTAALSAVSDWFDAVDAALLNDAPAHSSNQPLFALVRPPSHHACQSKGMGGCLLNSAAIAAHYALSLPNCQTVGILDIDAHHGNGIAHCVQDEPRIKYVSVHENVRDNKRYTIDPKVDPTNPRSDREGDSGPLNNILNVALGLKSGWESGYKDALVTKALPFLCDNHSNSNSNSNTPPDILLVAAGFDALDADYTSSFTLSPDDYGKMGQLLKDTFGNKVGFGLEGGYCYKKGHLSRAVNAFVRPWQT